MKEDKNFFKENDDFRNLAKKAKIKSNIRVVVVSLIVSLVVVIAFFYIGNTILNKTIDKESKIDYMWNSIHGANIEQQGTTINNSLITAITKTDFNKVIDGVSIPWVPREKRYSILGTSTVFTTTGPSGSGHINVQRIPMYYNGERATEFIHPQSNFGGTDDREVISKISDDKVIEVALSFDKGYSISDVQKVFGEKLAWFWVDTYTQNDINDFNDSSNQTGKDTTVIGDDVIGFRYIQESDKQYGAEHFINTLERLKEKGDYQGIATNIIQNITSNNQKDLTSDNLKIIGIVVTGTPSELDELIDLSMARAFFLGATADKY